jgi:AAA+ superfamily predicted ATPase
MSPDEPLLVGPQGESPPPAPPPEIQEGPYASSGEHLRDELARLDRLVRAHTVRWRSTLAATKPSSLWGMIHVTDQEVEDYLRSPFTSPRDLPAALRPALEPYWQQADEMAEAIARRRSATDIPLRLDLLAERFRLSGLQRDALLLCLLPELDGRYRRLFGYLQDDASRTRPTVELILDILLPEAPDPGDARDAFARGGPLVDRGLLAAGPEAQGEDPLPSRLLRIDDRIAAYLLGSELGSDRLDGRLEGIVTVFSESPGWDDLPSEPAQTERLRKLAAGWHEAEGARTVLLHGPYGSGRLAAARALAGELGMPLLAVSAARALQSAEPWERVIVLAFREALLRGAALAWTGCETLLAADAPPWRWDRLTEAAEAFAGTTFLLSESAWEPAGRFRQIPFLRLDLPVPGYRHRRLLWEKRLPPMPGREALAETLANGFQLTAGQMEDALATARAHAALRDPRELLLTADDLHEGCRRQSIRRLTTFARRIEPRTGLTFDDLVLPPMNARQLAELRGRIAHQGRVQSELGFERRLLLGKGLLALFTGSSGTGKTMAAELLARERGVDLYKVDLSAVVSKWVGETEKNLSRLFAEAEDANAILFFDEADALFGKRGEVRDARDRWANLEIDYLLQRVEEYAGVVILASNLRQNIDEAFLRRIQVLVDFPSPDAGARLRILRGLFPDGVDRPEDAGLRLLADRFQLPGGSLKNIVLDATFRSLSEEAGSGRPAITLRHLALSTAREYQKLGRPITRSEFGEELYAWLDETIL